MTPKIEFESVEEFLQRGGKITQCPPGDAMNSQAPQTMRVRGAFNRGRKAFTLGIGSKGVCAKKGRGLAS